MQIKSISMKRNLNKISYQISQLLKFNEIYLNLCIKERTFAPIRCLAKKSRAAKISDIWRVNSAVLNRRCGPCDR